MKEDYKFMTNVNSLRDPLILKISTILKFNEILNFSDLPYNFDQINKY
jgi:hypothetical protein